jgi:hypothetical protein
LPQTGHTPDSLDPVRTSLSREGAVSDADVVISPSSSKAGTKDGDRGNVSEGEEDVADAGGMGGIKHGKYIFAEGLFTRSTILCRATPSDTVRTDPNFGRMVSYDAVQHKIYLLFVLAYLKVGESRVGPVRAQARA